MIDPQLAYDATGTVANDRMETHGDPYSTMAGVAKMWSAYLGIQIDAAEASQMMVLLKIARAHRGYARDHYLDQIGYVLIAESITRPWSESK